MNVLALFFLAVAFCLIYTGVRSYRIRRRVR